jgi:hypothetical protein
MQDEFAPSLKESILYYAKKGIDKTLATVILNSNKELQEKTNTSFILNIVLDFLESKIYWTSE